MALNAAGERAACRMEFDTQFLRQTHQAGSGAALVKGDPQHGQFIAIALFIVETNAQRAVELETAFAAVGLQLFAKNAFYLRQR